MGRAEQRPRAAFGSLNFNHYGYPLGASVEDPRLLPAFVEDKNGHILPYVTFDGGRLQLSEAALQTLRVIADKRR